MSPGGGSNDMVFPRSVYVDRHSIYRDEDHAEKSTQFGRAMKELSRWN